MQLSKEQKELVLKRDELIAKRYSKTVTLGEIKILNHELLFINKQLGI